MHDTASVEQVKIPAWAWLVVLMAAGAMYLMTLDNGLAFQGLAERFHEFFHDGRHFLGVPCH